MITNMLIALDGSDDAIKALELACDIAARHDATVHLLNVVERTDLPDPLRRFAEAEHIPGAPYQVYEFIAKGILEEAEERAKDNGVKTVKTVIRHGDAVEQILDYAKEEGIDVIAVGSRGLSDVTGLLLGSVSHKIGNLAPCTSLIVR